MSAPTPKRIPGEANPTADPTQTRLIQNAAHAAAGGSAPGDFGIGALLAWRRRRQAARRAAEAAKNWPSP